MTTPDATASEALSCSVSVGYDGHAVARDIELRIDHGRILAVLGPNGAGKTTLLLTLAGFLPPVAGTIALSGRPVRAGSARRMNKAGVVLVPDRRALFTQLTTLENLRVVPRARRHRGRAINEVLEMFPALRQRSGVRAGMLSGGEQQMLALARALVQRPDVLLIDEMSMGLAPVIVESLMPILRTVVDQQQAAIVLVEQHVHLALEVADEAVVLVHGHVALRERADVVRKDVGRLEAAYLSLNE